MKIFLNVVFGFFILTPVYGEAAFNEIFSDRYFNHYEAGKCGLHLLVFIKKLNQEDLSLEGVSLVEISNKGFSVFGMVNVEKARVKRFDKPAVDERNWYHHVIAVDTDGTVYDFDFSIEPSPLAFAEYVETMFLDEPECETPAYGKFCAGREEKLKNYQLRWTHASDLVNEADPKPYHVGSLGEALDRHH